MLLPQFATVDNQPIIIHTIVILQYDNEVSIMPKTTKIAISLPEAILSAVEKERKASGESRSELFRRAVEMLLRRNREQAMSERYVRAYEQMPETREEIDAARTAASAILAGELWQ